MKYITRSYLLTISFLLVVSANAQLTISGSTCVVAGTQYQYVISGITDSTSTIKVCITAGKILNSADSSNYCATITFPATTILVVWDDSTADIGSLNISSAPGNASLSVYFTQVLQPGLIDSLAKMQVLTYNTVPINITCSLDSGGSCSPAYAYQWQQSLNGVSWTNIPFADRAYFGFNSPVTQSTYYRRKVIETGSGSIDYSDVASVFVMLPQDSTNHGDSVVSFSGNKSNIKMLLKKYRDVIDPNTNVASYLWLTKPVSCITIIKRKKITGKA